AAVLEYLLKSNRPYSANDISSQLHGLVSPTQAKKILNDLADEEKVMRKVNGKQLIYYAIQADIDVPSVEEAEQEEDTIKELEERLAQIKDGNKTLSAQLSTLNNALTDDQMRERISKLTLEVSENETRLEHLRSGEIISPQEKSKIEKEHSAMTKHWATRKRMFREISNTISEGYPGKMKDLYEQLGIETDEDVGADTSIISSNYITGIMSTEKVQAYKDDDPLPSPNTTYEEAAILEDSPIEEVRAAVMPSDDTSLPSVTVRSVVLGLIFTLVLSF
ncbi:PSMC3 interacting protein, partial [Dipsacomyces acuminosporus]